MHIGRWFALVQVALCLALMASGCRRGPLPLTQVQGKVSYKGMPLTGGVIVFTPDASKGEAGRIAHSKIGSDGSYSLVTDEAKGASPGRYRVTVVSLASDDAPGPKDVLKTPASFLPEKYRDPELSQLSCEVKANKTNLLDFDLN